MVFQSLCSCCHSIVGLPFLAGYDYIAANCAVTIDTPVVATYLLTAGSARPVRQVQKKRLPAPIVFCCSHWHHFLCSTCCFRYPASYRHWHTKRTVQMFICGGRDWIMDSIAASSADSSVSVKVLSIRLA